METKDRPSQNSFLPLVGEQLSAVCFVQDYLQLDFDGYKLTTYTMPIVVNGDSNATDYHQSSYKNMLCDFITKKVRNVVYVEAEFVEIFFNEYKFSIKIIINKSVDNIYYSDYEEKWFVI